MTINLSMGDSDVISVGGYISWGSLNEEDQDILKGNLLDWLIGYDMDTLI